MVDYLKIKGAVNKIKLQKKQRSTYKVKKFISLKYLKLLLVSTIKYLILNK